MIHVNGLDTSNGNRLIFTPSETETAISNNYAITLGSDTNIHTSSALTVAKTKIVSCSFAATLNSTNNDEIITRITIVLKKTDNTVIGRFSEFKLWENGVYNIGSSVSISEATGETLKIEIGASQTCTVNLSGNIYIYSIFGL